MSTYENEQIGKIVIMRNLVFQNDKGKKEQIDHAWRRGRPCIIIYTDENYDYFIPIKSTEADEKYAHYYITLTDDDILYKEINKYNQRNINRMKSKNTNGHVNIEYIYKTPISWHDELGKITFETYKNIIETIKKTHKQENLNTLFSKAKLIKGR